MSLLKNITRIDRTCLWKFSYNMGWKGFKGFRKFQKRKKRGELFPAFQFISVTNDCNLRCQGCWVSKSETGESLDLEKINKIISDSKKYGSYFFGILGGEPLLYKPLMEIFKSHPDCYFQLFTNGTLLTNEIAAQLRKLGNVTPLISFEGDEEIADIRRGSSRVFQRTQKAIEIATQQRLVTGVAISVCKSNLEMALSDSFIENLIKKGVIYLWYYIYRPTGEDPHYELTLSLEEINLLRRFLVEGRKKYSIVIIDSYWSAEGEPFCPAIEGLSHHINPGGNIEPCPVIQFSKDQINGQPLKEIYENSDFIRSFKQDLSLKTHGCILMEDSAWLGQYMSEKKAINTSNRTDIIEKLVIAPRIVSHGSSDIIPEKQWIYRMAKKMAFFGLGAYG